MTSSGTCWYSSKINGITLQQSRNNMTKYQKLWFEEGYYDNQHGEHPEAFCQEKWMNSINDCGWGGKQFTLIVENFPFYKQGAIKAYNEKQQ
jgi:hypothetical protein